MDDMGVSQLGSQALNDIFFGSRYSDLKDVIQEVAGREGRMADYMAEAAVETVRELAEGREVSPERLKEATKLLEFVSIGTLLYVERLQGPVVI